MAAKASPWNTPDITVFDSNYSSNPKIPVKRTVSSESFSRRRIGCFCLYGDSIC